VKEGGSKGSTSGFVTQVERESERTMDRLNRIGTSGFFGGGGGGGANIAAARFVGRVWSLAPTLVSGPAFPYLGG
jgi:hypothetical protein